jgi:hypothetical protein
MLMIPRRVRFPSPSSNPSRTVTHEGLIVGRGSTPGGTARQHGAHQYPGREEAVASDASVVSGFLLQL